MKKLAFVFLTMVLCSPFQLFAQGDINNEYTIKVKDAIYGRLNNPPLTCSATSYLQYHCNGKADCALIVGNHMCGDPAPGVKQLLVNYDCGSFSRSTVATEYNEVRLTCRALK